MPTTTETEKSLNGYKNKMLNMDGIQEKTQSWKHKINYVWIISYVFIYFYLLLYFLKCCYNEKRWSDHVKLEIYRLKKWLFSLNKINRLIFHQWKVEKIKISMEFSTSIGVASVATNN